MGRIASIGYARLAAALCIVVFHCGPVYGHYFLVGLDFFIILPIVLLSGDSSRGRFSDALSRYASRYLRLWWIWSLIYLAIGVIYVSITSKTAAEFFQIWMLLTGPSLHLWFLPFAFVALVAAKMLLSQRISDLVTLLIALGLFLFACVLIMVSPIKSSPIPVAQWLSVTPALLLAISTTMFQRWAPAQWAKAAVIIPAVLFFIFGVWAGDPYTTGRAAFALLVIQLCLSFRAPATEFSGHLTGLSLHVYLIHPALVATVAQTPWLEVTTWEGAISAVVLAVITGLVIEFRIVQRLACHVLQAAKQLIAPPAR